MGRYDDIINLPHYVSKDRPRMPKSARAAQFAPFAALTGFEDEIQETARLTDGRAELDEYVKAEINERLVMLKETISSQPKAAITYFVADERKSGGKYVTVRGKVVKIDEYARLVIMADETKIPIDDIYSIEKT